MFPFPSVSKIMDVGWPSPAGFANTPPGLPATSAAAANIHASSPDLQGQPAAGPISQVGCKLRHRQKRLARVCRARMSSRQLPSHISSTTLCSRRVERESGHPSWACYRARYGHGHGHGHGSGSGCGAHDERDRSCSLRTSNRDTHPPSPPSPLLGIHMRGLR